VEEWFNVNKILQLYGTDRHNINIMVDINSIQSNDKKKLSVGNIKREGFQCKNHQQCKQISLFFHEQIHFTIAVF